MPPVATNPLRAAPWLLWFVLAPGLTAQDTNPPAPPDAGAQQRAAIVRASMILRIAPYITYDRPQATRREFYRIAVVGADGVTAVAVEHLNNKKVDERTIQVVIISVDDAKKATRAAQYDLLYLAGSLDAETRKAIVASHADRPVALVCEAPGFAKGGGGVQLFVKDNNIKFDVNAAALQRQGLRADAHLLKLAKKGPE